jgi:hypothetical protein
MSPGLTLILMAERGIRTPEGSTESATCGLIITQRTKDAIVARAPLPILSYAELPKASLRFATTPASELPRGTRRFLSVAYVKTIDLAATACVPPKDA